MKRSVLIGMLAVVAAIARAHDSQPADVTIYVKGDTTAPGFVEQRARASVTRIFARAGLRLAWRDGDPGSGAPAASPVSIEVRFTGEGSGTPTPGAFAYASPLGEGATTITVLYDRLRWVDGRPGRKEAILGHVLAHEIGHVLQRTNRHAQTGIMKAHWNRQDYDAMERKQLGFTADDVDLMIQGWDALKARP